MSSTVMNRTQRRKAGKNEKQPTYCLTKAQLEKIVEETKSEGESLGLALALTLPFEVLMDHYWPKTYQKKLPGFVDHVLEYYERWLNGELDMEEMKQHLWEVGGVKLERKKAE